MLAKGTENFVITPEIINTHMHFSNKIIIWNIKFEFCKNCCHTAIIIFLKHYPPYYIPSETSDQGTQSNEQIDQSYIRKLSQGAKCCAKFYHSSNMYYEAVLLLAIV